MEISESEARSILATVPRDLWVEVILSNPELSMKDVAYFCSVSSEFQEFCKQNEIWKTLARKEASESEFEMLESIKGTWKERLFALRLMRYAQKGGFVPFQNKTSQREVNVRVTEAFFVEILIPSITGHEQRVAFWKDVTEMTDADIAIVGLSPKAKTFVPKTRQQSNEFVMRLAIFLFQRGFHYQKRNKEGARIQCAMCSQLSASTCAHCETQYCSQECANEHWPVHSKISHQIN